MRKINRPACQEKCRQIVAGAAAIAGKPLCQRVIRGVFTACLVGVLAAIYLGEFDAEEYARAVSNTEENGSNDNYRNAATNTDAQPEENTATGSDAEKEATGTDAEPVTAEVDAEPETTATDALAIRETESYKPNGRNTMMTSIYDVNYIELMTIPGSNILRCYVSAITVLDSLSEAPAQAWDISYCQDGSVMAWVIGDDEGMYHLYLTADSPIRAPVNSDYLFAGYSGLKELSFNGNFDSSSATSLIGFFYDCSSLESLDVSCLDTSNAESISFMFGNCQNLKSLDLSNFDTSKVTDMSLMFFGCQNLKSLDLSSFDTSKVSNMDMMFRECSSLTQLIENFDMTNVIYTSDMYYGTIWEEP